jgi:hypothetical protein
MRKSEIIQDLKSKVLNILIKPQNRLRAEAGLRAFAL